ncbi:putative phage-like protein YoqJ [Evansella vedderi]|uniref:Phage-like protein YoqJ n=1 Tax=Evansella vedderi TaxID=38282 RepID=A0ABT9ZX11_9BACI|nr:SLOG family protein [Evansella vedderi]MDQ0255763.1 putative phage-like protein YoqJ [Evansella vedderi]
MYQVIAVTGYKPHELGIFNEKHDHLPFLKYAIKRKLQQLMESYDIQWIITSGQPGVELWAAEAALELKRDFPQLQLATFAPFYNQEERWSDPIKELYLQIWSKSDYTDYITKREYSDPSQLKLKNQFIIDKSNAFLVLFDEYTEGSPTYYLSYARKKAEAVDYPIIYLTPDEIEEVIRDLQQEDSWN